LIGHGFLDENNPEPWAFRVNAYDKSLDKSLDDIALKSDELNDFIEKITSLEEHPVYIFMESCYSGGFIEDLRKLRGTPITSTKATQKCLKQPSPFIVTSSAANQPSWQEKTLDSSFLYSVWHSIFHKGYLFSEAFEHARANFEGQKPQSCDGTFKDNNLGDRVISKRVSAAAPPYINISEKNDKIECQVKYVEKGFDLVSVWASIKPPNYSHLPVYPKTGLAYDNVPTVPLSEVEKNVLYTGQFNGFVKDGVYKIRCYVKNIKGDVYKSSEKELTISKGHSVKVDVNLDIPSTIQRGTEFKVSRNATGQGEYDEYEAVVFPDGKFFIIVAPDVIFDFSRVEPFSRKRIVLSPEGDTRNIVSFTMPNEIPTGKYEWYSIFVVPGGDPLKLENWMGYDTKKFEVVE